MGETIRQQGHERELERWKRRTWHPEWSYEGDEANEIADKILGKAEMVNVCFRSKEDLYKFMDYGIKKGKIRNSELTFIRSDTFRIYIFTDYKYVNDCFDYVKEFISDCVGDCRNKWVVCDSLDTEFDYKSSGYLVSKLKSSGCRGVLYCIGDDSDVNNFYECTYSKNLCQTELVEKLQEK